MVIKINEKLTILHDDNTSFADYSREMAGYDRDTASFTYIAAEDSIYIGFYKPINTFFIDFATANTNAATLSVLYYNGSSFTAVDGLHDDSKGFTRSGFVRWDRNQKDASDNLDEAKTTINSLEKYWYKLDLDVDSSAMVINGINIVFSDDQDLKRVYFESSRFLPSGESTHILTHVAARDEIIQTLNLKGKYKNDNVSGYETDISAFDLLEISEVKLASTYLVLSMIFLSVSDQVDDAYLQKSQIYRAKYNDIIDNMDIKVDRDDDGKYDRGEREKFGYGFITRL